MQEVVKRISYGVGEAVNNVLASSEEGEELRIEAFKKKKSQLDAVKPDRLVTACANCRIVLEEGLEHYQMDIPVVGLTEMIAEHIPEKGA